MTISSSHIKRHSPAVLGQFLTGAASEQTTRPASCSAPRAFWKTGRPARLRRPTGWTCSATESAAAAVVDDAVVVAAAGAVAAAVAACRRVAGSKRSTGRTAAAAGSSGPSLACWSKRRSLEEKEPNYSLYKHQIFVTDTFDRKKLSPFKEEDFFIV